MWVGQPEAGRVHQQPGQVGGRGDPVEEVEEVPVRDRVKVGKGGVRQGYVALLGTINKLILFNQSINQSINQPYLFAYLYRKGPGEEMSGSGILLYWIRLWSQQYFVKF